ncbi:TonB-dependent receptor plug domain-containing protein [Tunturibacter empetritectus]|uniref:Iron complex outermembrane receptor protein/vitamin B12 transporter n=1 Tax=Tunturiibacter empetritectus TaxID=3069691 RepID=A0A7W8IE53_9BACT|nr:TonB-dependent receptor plug domain-containing protein [Edaphobacter lichenicola]MBB5315484.1 iron complex outermembrane receptor protein/vitamin B12 transporter [Edaphobacter lichenicola]
MQTPAPRSAISLLLALAAALLLTLPARAVVVRGTVTTPLGTPLGNARIQLIQGRRVVAFTFTLMDGTYELRSGLPGRFVLLTSASPFTPSIGDAFYGGRTAIVTRNLVLEYATVTPQLATTSTAIPTPIQQVPAAITLIPAQSLETQINLLNDLRQAPGTNAIQTGQAGGPISLYLRGGSPDANKILIDGIPATNIGGPFDFTPLATTALTGPEIYRGANSALQGTGAEASIVSLATTRSNFLHPTLDYTGDAGNLHTYRNEAILSGTFKRLDYQAAFSRLNTSNALPRDQFHLITSTANIGYTIFTNTTARFTLRNADSAAGLPQAHDLYGISASGKQSDQDLYSGITVENVLAGNWHNLARYGVSRKREQEQQFDRTGNATINGILVPHVTYGNVVILRGANGYSATGQAAFLSPTLDNVHNRDELYYQTDYTFPYRISALFSFHYEDERGRLYNPTTGFNQQAQRTNFQYTLQLQGDLHHRIFYSFGGAIERNHLYGTAGTPRLGLTYVPVLPGHRAFHGTSLRANIATGVQEPTLEDQFTSLDTLLAQTANQSAIATYNIHPIAAQRSRTFDVAVDQNILNQKLILKAGYFHNQFSHQLERLAPNGLEQYFNIPANIALQVPAASLNSLAYRTQGLELELQYQPLTHLFLRAGYTYLASLVEQSFTSDNVSPAFNPDLPGIPIGALSPIVGNRPFNRPPSTGFFAAQYTASRFSAAIKGALASRSDDSTFQLHNDRNGGNTLLLPNQNLDFGYAKLDLNLLFSATRHVTAFTQLDNLLSQQHIGPIGYPGLPFTIRAGLKIRIGGN